ncbi:MAG: hypothetical protein IIA49_13810 [Bacteroidetes bacterium]|nr:hypothetical protein [Bacteroidota bacterium]
MKTLKILLLLLALFPFSNIFSQYFIDHDKVEQVWQQNLKGYWAKPEEVKDKNIYLQSINKGSYISDVKIGFDKIEYKSDDLITITLKRGYENETDSEMVSISGCAEVFSDQIEIQKYEPAPYYLYLKKGQEIEITLNCKGRKFVRLGFLLGPHLGPHSGESRSYIIRYSDRLTAETPKDSVSNNKLIINNFMIGPSESKTVPPDTEVKVQSPSISY